MPNGHQGSTKHKRQALANIVENIAGLDSDENDAVRELLEQIRGLKSGEIKAVSSMVETLHQEKEFWRDPESTIITDEILEGVGARLRIHHSMSYEAFSKDKFEFAMIGAARDAGYEASKAIRGNRGEDIKIEKIRYSLKTQADAEIKNDKVMIPKYQELGKGNWTDKPEQLRGLLGQFFEHLSKYERILVLRRLHTDASQELYELVEIPKPLFERAQFGVLEMKTNSSQAGAKPGYCYVREKDEKGKDKLIYQLYFDGGSERKLRVQHLLKCYCTPHATWRFALPPEVAKAKHDEQIEREEEKRRKAKAKAEEKKSKAGKKTKQSEMLF
jgi:hypothetical protein